MKDSDGFTKGKRGSVIQAKPGERGRVQMKAIALSSWDVMDHLHSEEDIAAYLEACRAENNVELMEKALAAAERARRQLTRVSDDGSTQAM